MSKEAKVPVRKINVSGRGFENMGVSCVQFGGDSCLCGSSSDSRSRSSCRRYESGQREPDKTTQRTGRHHKRVIKRPE